MVKLDELELLIGILKSTDEDFHNYTYNKIKDILYILYDMDVDIEDIKLVYETPLLNKKIMYIPEEIKEDLLEDFDGDLYIDSDDDYDDIETDISIIDPFEEEDYY